MSPLPRLSSRSRPTQGGHWEGGGERKIRATPGWALGGGECKSGVRAARAARAVVESTTDSSEILSAGASAFFC